MSRESLPEFNSASYAQHLERHGLPIKVDKNDPVSTVKVDPNGENLFDKKGIPLGTVLIVGMTALTAAALEKPAAVVAAAPAREGNIFDANKNTLDASKTEWAKALEAVLPVDKVLERLNSGGIGGENLSEEVKQKLVEQKMMLAKTIASSPNFPLSDVSNLGAQYISSKDGSHVRLIPTYTPDLANPGNYSVLLPNNYNLAAENPYMGIPAKWKVVKSDPADPYELVFVAIGKTSGWIPGQATAFVNNDGSVTDRIKYIDPRAGVLKEFKTSENKAIPSLDVMQGVLFEQARAKATQLMANYQPLYYVSDGAGLGEQVPLGMVRDQNGVMYGDITAVVAGARQKVEVDGHVLYAIPVVVGEQAPLIMLFPAGEKEVCGYVRINENNTTNGSGGSGQRYCDQINPPVGQTIWTAALREYPQQFVSEVPQNRKWMIEMIKRFNSQGFGVAQTKNGSGMIFVSVMGGR